MGPYLGLLPRLGLCLACFMLCAPVEEPGCNCKVSTQTMESSGTLALLVLAILFMQQARRRRSLR